MPLCARTVKLMGKTAKIKERGIKLGVVNYVMLAVTLIISALLLAANYNSSKAYRELDTTAENYIIWHKNADDIQAASDYLTERVRLFSVTGEKRYIDDYFTEAKETRRRETALHNIEDMSFNSESYNSLENAVNASYALMDTEYYAMRLTVEGCGYDVNLYPEEVKDVVLSAADLALTAEEQKDAAINMLCNDAYSASKEEISGHIAECISTMDREFAARQKAAAGDLAFMFRYEQLLIIGYIIVVTLLILLITLNILVPLTRAIPCIKEDGKIPVQGAYEYRYLAETYNKMYDLNREHKEKLMREATHDALTGIFNRREFEQILVNNDKNVFAIALFDVDRFKQVNDVHGHDVGDAVLTKVSKKIEKIFKGVGHACRIGGDEIAVIITGKETDKDVVYEKSASVNAAISSETDIPAVTVSAGVAYYEEGMTINSLFKHADRALYMTKRNQRGGCTVYNTQE